MVNSTFGFERPEDSPGFLLWQTTITWQRLINRALGSYHISHAQFVILAILLWFEEHNQKPTQILITKMSKLDKMTVSKALSKLVEHDFVKRTEHEEDSRAKSVCLTTKGKNLVSQLVPIVEAIDAEFFGLIPLQNQQHLVSALSELITKLEKQN